MSCGHLHDQTGPLYWPLVGLAFGWCACVGPFSMARRKWRALLCALLALGLRGRLRKRHLWFLGPALLVFLSARIWSQTYPISSLNFQDSGTSDETSYSLTITPNSGDTIIADFAFQGNPGTVSVNYGGDTFALITDTAAYVSEMVIYYRYALADAPAGPGDITVTTSNSVRVAAGAYSFSGAYPTPVAGLAVSETTISSYNTTPVPFSNSLTYTPQNASSYILDGIGEGTNSLLVVPTPAPGEFLGGTFLSSPHTNALGGQGATSGSTTPVVWMAGVLTPVSDNATFFQIISEIPFYTPTFTPTPTYTATPCGNPQVYDGYATSTQASETLDSTGPDGPLVMNGSVDYYTSPAPPNGGTWCFGNFSDSNYLSGGSDLLTAMSNRNIGGVDLEWYPTDLSDNTQIPLQYTDNKWGVVIFQGGPPVNDYPIWGLSDGGDYTANTTVPMTVNAWNELTLTWYWAQSVLPEFTNGFISWFVNGTLVGSQGYGLQFGTNTVTDLTIGADSTRGPGSPATGYICQIHFLDAAVNPPIVDSCSATPLPTQTAAATYVSTPTPDATPVPQCWTTPPLTVLPTPLIYPGPTPGIIQGEPDLAYEPGDPYGNQIHSACSMEDNNTDEYHIDLLTAPALVPWGNGSVTGVWTDQGTIVGNGVLGVTAEVHTPKEISPTGQEDNIWVFYGSNPGSGQDGTGNEADGSIYCAQSVNGGYNYITATVTKIIPIDSLAGLWPIADTVSGLYVVGVEPDPFTPDLFQVVIEMDNQLNYGIYPSDLLWHCELTWTGSAFELTEMDPQPMMEALCDGSGGYSQGPRAFWWDAALGQWDMFEGNPDGIIHLRSPDLFHWTCDGYYTLTLGNTPNWLTPNSPDQVADMAGAIEYNGYTYFAFDETDNGNATNAGGIAVFPGTPGGYGTCALTTLTPTETWTDSPTISPTWTDSPTPSPTATPTATPTWTPTATPTDTPLASSTWTASPSPTITLTASPTFTVTPTLTVTMTFSASPTISPTWSVSWTSTISPTFSASPTPFPSATATPDFTATPDSSPTPSASVTPTITPFSGWTPFPTPPPLTWTPVPHIYSQPWYTYPVYPTPTAVPTNSCAWCW